LYESEAKELLRKHQIPVPKGGVATSPAEAEKIAADLGGPVVVKALALFGGRHQASARNAAEAKAAAEKLLATEIGGKKPEKVLIEQDTDAATTYSLRITYDGSAKLPVMLGTAVTGKDIDDVADDQPDAVKRRYFSALLPPSTYRAKELVSALGATGGALNRMTGVVHNLNHVLMEYDLNIVDVPRLSVTKDGKVVVDDVFMDMEIEARTRQKPNLDALGVDPKDARVPREPTEFDKKGAQIDKDDPRGVAGPIVEFDGNIGCVIGAGGGSLTTFDAIRGHGGRPANYAAIGGNPSVGKCKELTKLVLSKPGVEKIVVISNVVSNTRADLLARGVIKGVIELGKKPSEVIAIFRSPGAWEADAAKILKKYGVEYCDRTVSISEAARRGVEKIGK